MKDYQELPKLRDGLGYLYIEHAIIEQEHLAVAAIDKDGKTQIPAASLAVLMLGPGTSITHAAIKALADNGCLVIWCGENGVRYYGQGYPETRKAWRVIKQAELVSDMEKRFVVISRMYHARFGYHLPDNLSLEQVRGMEGVRVRDAYAKAAKEYEIDWKGRKYDRNKWENSDPVNRALSAANACLNGICHAAIVSGGYSPALGFIHTGKQLSFVYDIADLYKVDITVPLAFRVVNQAPSWLESAIRQECRIAFKEYRLLDRILPDIDKVLNVSGDESPEGPDIDLDGACPTPLWNPSDNEPKDEQDGGDDT